MSRYLIPVIALLAALGLYAYAFSEETPIGAVRGQVTAADTGKPLPGVRLVLRPANPKDGGDVLWAKTDKDGRFEVRRVPAGAWEAEPMTSAYQNTPKKTTVAEGETAALEMKLQPGDPYLQVFVHQNTYLPGENPRIAVQGFRQGEELRLRLLAVDDATLFRDYGSRLRALLAPTAATGQPGTFKALQGGQVRPLREWAHRLENVNAEGVFYDYEHLGKLQPGIYLVQAQGAKTESVGWLMVTDLAVVTKSAGGEVRAFTCDLRTGKPLPGTQLTVFTGENGEMTKTVTDGSGMTTFSLAAGEDVSELIAKRGASVAFTRFYPSGYGAEDRFRVFTYTDRPVYRPGHKVRFKGVARKMAGAAYAVPAGGPVDVEVTDDQETVIHRAALTMNDRGSFAGQFDLPSEIRTGVYTIKVKVNGEEHTDTFAVASYRKPEWRVEVAAAKNRYVRGDRVPVTVRAEYYYGQPVPNAQVEWTVFRAPYWSWWGDEEYYADEEEFSGGYGEIVGEGTATTGADGAASFQFGTTGDPEESLSGEYQYNIDVSVTDLSQRYASGDTKVRVSSGEVTLDARPTKHVAAPGDEVSVQVRARDLEDKPVAGASIRAETVLSVWTGKGEAEQRLASQTLTTDAQGMVTLPVQLSEPGLVLVKLQTTDRRGNKIDASTDVWVSTADGGDFGARYPTLSVIPDKKLYRIGDTAQVLINTDRPGATALVSVEAEGVLELKQVVLKNRSTVVRFPVRKGYEPNVFVSACFVKDREFTSSEARLSVDAEAHRLNVTVESDREVYKPGDTAVYRIRTTDGKGKGVPAEVSFGVVDEAVYAIREEPRRGMWEAFYPRRQNAVATQFSFPEVYLGDADKAGKDLAVRKNFPDTAHWDPFLRTDASGQATVRVQIPDSLTSWRATAVAHTAGTQIGKATQNIKVMRELTLRLQTPRALTEGDRQTLSAVAHNYSGKPLDVTVDLHASGLEFSGETRRQVRLDPNEAERIEWEATATTPGSAKVTATASGGGFADGMETRVPVLPFAKETVVVRSGALTGDSAGEDFPADPGAVEGEAEIRISPTLAGTLLGSLEYLATYPYGCTEQTMSSFLPNVVLRGTLNDFKLNKPELAAKLPAMTEAGLLRLYRYQHYDGGWGWWEYDQADPWMTAYVVFGMTLAKERGIPVNERAYRSGISALETLATSAEMKADDAMFAAYALALAKEPVKARPLLARLEKSEGKLLLRSLGYAALALLATGQEADRRRAEALVEKLWARADRSEGMISWSEKAREEYGLPADVETTAVILKAATEVNPEDRRLAEVVRWLLLRRQGNRWQSTRDTAFILFALNDYLKATGELNPDYRMTVLLNGEPIHTAEVRPGGALEEETVVRVPVSRLKAANRLEVRKQGEGTLYYGVQVRQKVRAASFNAESSRAGLSVSREYFRLQNRRDEGGRIVTEPEKRAADGFRLGDRILVRLTVKTDRPLEYMMLEDPLPSGFEVQDRGDVGFDDWSYWWSHMDIRDDRVNLFMRSIPKGEHTVEYYLRPEMTGNVRALPAVLSDMYSPAVRASTGEAKLGVRR